MSWLHASEFVNGAFAPMGAAQQWIMAVAVRSFDIPLVGPLTFDVLLTLADDVFLPVTVFANVLGRWSALGSQAPPWFARPVSLSLH